MRKGNFIVSLDFELHWGAPELWDLNEMREYFNDTRIGIPLVLKLFEKHEIHATWATVGFLFAKDKKQLLEYVQRWEEYLKKDIENKDIESIEESTENVEHWKVKLAELEKEIDGIEKLQKKIIATRLGKRD